MILLFLLTVQNGTVLVFDLQAWKNKVELLFLSGKILILKLKSGSDTPRAVLLAFWRVWVNLILTLLIFMLPRI